MVCIGNICRSPMAEYYFLNQFSKLDKPIKVSSAGLGALVGRPADPSTLEILGAHGIDASAHRARQINTQIVSDHELILVMEAWQQRELEKLFPVSRGRVYRIGKWSDFDMPDPYKKPKAAFDGSFKYVQQGYQDWAKKLGIK